MNITDEVIKELIDLEDKYRDLVWYARSGVDLDSKEPDLKEKIFTARERIEESYPKETWKYNNIDLEPVLAKITSRDWEHGFNSGCLAAFRFVLTASGTNTYFDEDLGEEVSYGGLPEAQSDFPELDT